MSLTLEHIDYKIKEKAILKALSCSFQPGELSVIIGPNGAGKSSLLHLLSGKEQPTHGSIKLYDKPLTQIDGMLLAKHRAVLMQQSLVNMNFTVHEVICMGRYPHIKNRPTSWDLKIVAHALEKCGTAHLAQRNYTSLSGGEKQRVNLARVLAQVWEGVEEESRLLLLDEPLNNLDVEHQHLTLDIARDFAKNGNIVITVLHDLNMAARYADKIYMIGGGHLKASGNPFEVIHPPLIQEVFNYPACVCKHPFLNCPMVYYGDYEQSAENETLIPLHTPITNTHYGNTNSK
ncbi:heme ABC transporter ATP-binding protein [Porifericola rhodea]|uniref:heme ABC transporter ATP-binding protein n=1 Tax=Porifericola rhodea TaxID=930972 RepID=UPI0026669807|nr:heme ABC transporter ATP-binding protein [Porifericola rhodea]WKN30259.1 heme ABC transporter ATP-binding protein [Porifericola rhodea]